VEYNRFFYDEIVLLRAMKANIEEGYPACLGMDCSVCEYESCRKVGKEEKPYDQLRVIEQLLREKRA
jgi:uncharacterized ferredoxin-like protein